jgi:CheY-like chemotaxis protein
LRLLYIEDTVINVKIMERVSTHLGYELVIAHNAAEGLLSLSKSPDIILVDISLPDLDGLTLVREIRKQMPDAPIVAVTASAMQDDRGRCLAAGCNDYVAKPFGWNMMLELLRSYEKQRLSG